MLEIDAIRRAKHFFSGNVVRSGSLRLSLRRSARGQIALVALPGGFGRGKDIVSTPVVDGIMDQLGPQGIAQIAQSLGTDETTASKAVASAVPTILAGMANNSRSSDGAASLNTALDDHSDSIFGHLGDLLGGGGDGAKILGHVLGGNLPKVEGNLAQQSGLDLGLIMKLLPILAPLVMGYLSREKQSGDINEGNIGGVLAEECQQAEKRQPGLGSLTSILDADGDGSIIDDVLGRITGR